jgi:hypothetical protein
MEGNRKLVREKLSKLLVLVKPVIFDSMAKSDMKLDMTKFSLSGVKIVFLSPILGQREILYPDMKVKCFFGENVISLE